MRIIQVSFEPGSDIQLRWMVNILPARVYTEDTVEASGSLLLGPKGPELASICSVYNHVV